MTVLTLAKVPCVSSDLFSYVTLMPFFALFSHGAKRGSLAAFVAPQTRYSSSDAWDASIRAFGGLTRFRKMRTLLVKSM